MSIPTVRPGSGARGGAGLPTRPPGVAPMPSPLGPAPPAARGPAGGGVLPARPPGVPPVPVGEPVDAGEWSTRPSRGRRAAGGGGVMLTGRDVAILRFLTRYRYATYPQIAAAFGVGYSALRHRLPRLAREGLLVRRGIGKSGYGVWLPTDAGVRVGGLDLPTPTLSWATVAHTLGLVDIGIRFEALGETVVTEREIRAADTRERPGEGDGPRYLVPLGGPGGVYRHVPDLVLARPPAADGAAQSVAVELELVHKPAAQWRKILRGYREAPHLGGVVYFVASRKIAVGIDRAAREVGAEQVVAVRRFTPADGALPEPDR